MDKLIFFFVIWVIWKVGKPILDKYLQDVQGQLKEQQKGTQPPDDVTHSRTVTTLPAASGETASWELGQPVPGEEGGDELEQWFQEALERKRQIGGAPATREAPPPPPIPMREPERAEPFPSPRPARRQREAYPREAQQRVEHRVERDRVEPRVERHREVRVEKKRVVVPREPAMAEPGPKHAKRPGQGKGARQRVRQEPAVARLAGIGKWDMHDIRKGIILAEILGAPKALREIDSHII